MSQQEIFFTADQHYGHSNIIKYCKRPFENVLEMDEALIKKHNEVVSHGDIVFHLGDFSLIKDTSKVYSEYVQRLNGKHAFIMGSHDKWVPYNEVPYIIERNFGGIHIIMCHYAMRVWPRSHYNSWQLYGHSHGNLKPVGKQWDVGVDNNNFYPVSLTQLKEIMITREDNFNLVKKLRS